LARKNLQVNAKRRKDFYDIIAKLNSYAEYDKVWYLNEVRKEGVFDLITKFI
jgi:preprotein translocase subunit SecB